MRSSKQTSLSSSFVLSPETSSTTSRSSWTPTGFASPEISRPTIMEMTSFMVVSVVSRVPT